MHRTTQRAFECSTQLSLAWPCASRARLASASISIDLVVPHLVDHVLHPRSTAHVDTFYVGSEAALLERLRVAGVRVSGSFVLIFIYVM
eukprot:3625034-Prymnesium_polylepis.1